VEVEMSNIAVKSLCLGLLTSHLAWSVPTALAGQPVEPQALTRTTTPATTSQPTCLPHDGASAKMRQQYGEKLLGRGVSSDGTLLEIFLSAKGSFTVIKTAPTGLSCVVDYGEGWQTLNQLDQVGFSPRDLESVPAPF
jgi:hypothetical protein